jgi:hypothetical protein
VAAVGGGSSAEFAEGMRRLGLGLLPRQAEELLRQLDPAGTGRIQLQAFVQELAGRPAARQAVVPAGWRAASRSSRAVPRQGRTVRPPPAFFNPAYPGLFDY